MHKQITILKSHGVYLLSLAKQKHLLSDYDILAEISQQSKLAKLKLAELKAHLDQNYRGHSAYTSDLMLIDKLEQMLKTLINDCVRALPTDSRVPDTISAAMSSVAVNIANLVVCVSRDFVTSN